jgi:hypothetical protein
MKRSLLASSVSHFGIRRPDLSHAGKALVNADAQMQRDALA